MLQHSLAFSDVLAPLHNLMGWFVGPQKPGAAQLPTRPQSAATVSVDAKQRPRPRLKRPLRVLRITDGDTRPTEAGRMVISGSMADVCAELDRMVAAQPRR